MLTSQDECLYSQRGYFVGSLCRSKMYPIPPDAFIQESDQGKYEVFQPCQGWKCPVFSISSLECFHKFLRRIVGDSLFSTYNHFPTVGWSFFFMESILMGYIA